MGYVFILTISTERGVAEGSNTGLGMCAFRVGDFQLDSNL